MVLANVAVDQVPSKIIAALPFWNMASASPQEVLAALSLKYCAIFR